MKTYYTKGLFVFIFIIAQSCHKAVHIKITGIVDSINNTKVILVGEDFVPKYDSTIIKNNSFTINATVPEEGFYYIKFGSNTLLHNGYRWDFSRQIYAEKNATYKLVAKGPEDIGQQKYNLQSTSYNQNKLSEFYHSYYSMSDSLKRRKARYMKLCDEALSKNMKLYRAYYDSIGAIDSMIDQSYPKTAINFIKNNKSTIMVPYLISEAPDIFSSYPIYKKALAQLDPKVKESKYYARAQAMLNSVKNIYAGAAVPPIYGKDVSGRTLKIDYKANKLILIDFWASYCAPCREQLPKLEKVYNKFKNSGFSVVSVSIDENEELWRTASTQEKIPWYNVAETVNQEDSKNIINFAVESIPVNYLISGDGKFITRNIEIDSLDRLLSKLKK